MFTILLVGSLLVGAFTFPDAAIGSGASFQPVPHARGVPQGELFAAQKGSSDVHQPQQSQDYVAADSSPPHVSGGYGAGGGDISGLHLSGDSSNIHLSGGGGNAYLGGGSSGLQFGGIGSNIHSVGGGGNLQLGGGGVSNLHLVGGGGNVHSGAGGGPQYGNNDPTRTIYVNVPQEQYEPLPPIAAGPPRKHYRIVFIRSPLPPQPQAILPPRVEQKTLIYVLHPRQTATQNVVEVPDVKHDPQVYFIQYDKEPPTSEELQKLVHNTIGGSGDINLNYGTSSIIDGAPGIPNVHPPSSQPIYAASEPRENTVSAYPKGASSRIQPAQRTQTFNQKSAGAQVPQNARNSLKVSQGFQEYHRQQQPKFHQARSATQEKTLVNAASEKNPVNLRPRPRRPEVFPKQKNAQHPVKRLAVDPIEPSENLKNTFKSSFNRPFRFGSKLKAKRTNSPQQKNTEEVASSKSS